MVYVNDLGFSVRFSRLSGFQAVPMRHKKNILTVFD